MIKKIVLIPLMVLWGLALQSQNLIISGRIMESDSVSSLPGANVVLFSLPDSLLVKGIVSSSNGFFELNNIKSGNYVLKISYLGYQEWSRKVVIREKPINFGRIIMQPNAQMLEAVKIEAIQTRVKIKGDTTEVNADAFKVNPDASAEDLVKKMPGVTTSNGQLKVNGEEVKKVLVDGKEFFGEDPTASLRNLPAEVVGSVQFYDKMSDQAEFTGFNDGDEQKTINILTKDGKNQGFFGNVYGGIGYPSVYNTGGALNFFNGEQRISIIGMSNNINQQNFSISDIMGLMSNAGVRPGPGGGGRSFVNNFFSGYQNGITQTNAFGLNYMDIWGKKWDVNASYFFNQTNNSNENQIVRNYFSDITPQYSEQSNSETNNINHRFNARLQYKINDKNKFTLTPRLTVQVNDYSATSRSFSINMLFADTVNDLNIGSWQKNSGFTFDNDILFQHKFAKKGRTISLNFNTQLQQSNGEGAYQSITKYFDSVSDSSLVNQDYTSNQNNSTWGGTLSYTEPFGKNSQLMAKLQTSVTNNFSEKLLFNLSDMPNPGMDSNLSNELDYEYYRNIGAIGYRFYKKGLSVTA
ncbi:MAG: TonB-dependent receptor, partial [Candidatus Marinimicrobia bacterium]|nr:TonB-dependent receptor [Candidatus Neomarinimicrobiota bacterium]